MGEHTAIEWCDHTFNPAIGCQKVGPGCDNCYAEAADKRFTGGRHWGPGAPLRANDGKWNDDWRINFDGGIGAGGWPVQPVGKKAAGRLLDGREWTEFPDAGKIDQIKAPAES